LAAVLLLGFAAGALIPSALSPLLFRHLLRQHASDESVQQMAKPMADMKAVVQKELAAPSSEVKLENLADW
jgi:hypothetical protein